MFKGFNKKRSSISNGNFDGDSKPNRTDCEPLNRRRQDSGSNGLTEEQKNMRKSHEIWEAYVSEMVKKQTNKKSKGGN